MLFYSFAVSFSPHSKPLMPRSRFPTRLFFVCPPFLLYAAHIALLLALHGVNFAFLRTFSFAASTASSINFSPEPFHPAPGVPKSFFARRDRARRSAQDLLSQKCLFIDLVNRNLVFLDCASNPPSGGKKEKKQRKKGGATLLERAHGVIRWS